MRSASLCSDEAPAGSSRFDGGVTIHHAGISLVDEEMADIGLSWDKDEGKGLSCVSEDAVFGKGFVVAAESAADPLAASCVRVSTEPFDESEKDDADLGINEVLVRMAISGTREASDIEGGIVSYNESDAGTSLSTDCDVGVLIAKGEGRLGLFVTCQRAAESLISVELPPPSSGTERRAERRGSVRSTTSNNDNGLLSDFGDVVIDARFRAASRAFARVDRLDGWGDLDDRVW